MTIFSKTINFVSSKLVSLFCSNRYGYRFISSLLDNLLKHTTPVSSNEFNIKITTPNSLCKYRADSFFEKEPATLLWLDSIPENTVLWDVGANIGLYSVYAALRSSAIVYSFEPSVFNLEQLARNIFINSCQDRVTILPLALTDQISIQSFNLSTTAWGGALSSFGVDFDQFGGKHISSFQYKTLGTPMSFLVDQLNIPQPDYLKIDVDGIEHFVLRGGSEILFNVKSVLVEVTDDFLEQSSESTLILKSAGFTLYRKDSCFPGSSMHNQWWIRGDSGPLRSD